MRVLLISANTERINLPTFPLGLACVAQATMDQRHEVEWLDLMAEKEPEEAVTQALKRFQPQAIGISVRNIDDQNMANPRFLLEQAKEVVRFCKRVSEVSHCCRRRRVQPLSPKQPGVPWCGHGHPGRGRDLVPFADGGS